jgi:hypothetical protein
VVVALQVAALAQAHLDPAAFLGAPRRVMDEAFAYQFAAASGCEEARRERKLERRRKNARQ